MNAKQAKRQRRERQAQAGRDAVAWNDPRIAEVHAAYRSPFFRHAIRECTTEDTALTAARYYMAERKIDLAGLELICRKGEGMFHWNVRPQRG